MPPYVARKRQHTPPPIQSEEHGREEQEQPPTKKRRAVPTPPSTSQKKKPSSSQTRSASQSNVAPAASSIKPSSSSNNKKTTATTQKPAATPRHRSASTSLSSLTPKKSCKIPLNTLSSEDEDSNSPSSSSSSDENDNNTSASEAGSSDFEDVDTSKPSPGKWKTVNGFSHVREYVPSNPQTARATSEEEEDEDDDDEMDWEDAIDKKNLQDSTTKSQTPQIEEPKISGDLELTLDSIPTNTISSFTDPHGKKKGPSKIERMIRTNTHCVHVQYLMFHNLLRNGWCCDKDLHKVLLDGLSPGVKKEIDRWRRACGENVAREENKDKQQPKVPKEGKIQAKEKTKSQKQRNWGKDATVALDDGSPTFRRGDPTVKLLKILSAYWRKRFTITAPGIRKQGYKDLARLEQEVKSARKGPHDPEEHGERIRNRKGFQSLAKKCTGSRDVGSQLFTALVRAIGIEAKLVASLQPIGFGWTKLEDANPAKNKKKDPASFKHVSSSDSGSSTEEDSHTASSEKADTAVKAIQKPSNTSNSARGKDLKPATSASGAKDQPISLTTDDSELSSAQSMSSDSEFETVVDTTPSKKVTSSKRYDRDLAFPVYWTEVLSPVTQDWIPIDPIVLNLVASNSESLIQFEPRGAKADKAKQVMAYVVAFSSDGTAKDVTVRYLKRRMWPGKTKGMRLPVEKVPVYNKHGKVKRHEEYDWFKTVMSVYGRSSEQRTVADDMEENGDLVPIRMARDASKGNEDTLQGYKNSTEFVLERHLRREEALTHGAKPVRHFTTGKGEKAKSEPVYRRADVVKCKTMESWHKEGREVKVGQQPLKHVPMRAVTLTRKREIEEVERETGEKQKQPLYSWNQTQWIIPPPIKDGVIPKNAYGNMDVYVPTMVPKGAVHIPLRSTAKVCRKLEIDYAEACTGFEFGNKMAVPVLTGVVVAEEHEHMVIDAWQAEEDARVKKERDKREKLALGMWKKMLAGLKIVQRVRLEYGLDADRHIQDAIHPMAGKSKKSNVRAKPSRQQVDLARNSEDEEEEEDKGDLHRLFGDRNADYSGGFIREGKKGQVEDISAARGGGFFPDDGDEEAGAGGFILEDDPDSKNNTKEKDASFSAAADAPKVPVSLQSMHQNLAPEDDGDCGQEQIEEDSLESDDDSHSKHDVKPVKKPKTATLAKKGVRVQNSEQGNSRRSAAKNGKKGVSTGIRTPKVQAKRTTKLITPPSDDDDDDNSDRDKDDNEDEYEDDDDGNDHNNDHNSGEKDDLYSSLSSSVSPISSARRRGILSPSSKKTTGSTRQSQRHAAKRSSEATRSRYFDMIEDSDDQDGGS